MVRRHVDEWISSGYRDGIETPLSRTLGRDLLAELDFLDREDRPFSVTVSPDGSVAGRFSRRHMLLPPESIGVPMAHKKWDAETAAYIMLLFLNYEDPKHRVALRHRLAKCSLANCASPYFYWERLYPHYERPALCPHHRKQAAGNRARKDEREELLALAVKFWPQWTERKHPNRARWVAKKMNAARNATERHIQPKWVSRNKQEIEDILLAVMLWPQWRPTEHHGRSEWLKAQINAGKDNDLLYRKPQWIKARMNLIEKLVAAKGKEQDHAKG